MKTFILFILFILFFANHSFACNVSNYKDAVKCIEKASLEVHHEGEMPHSVGATKSKKGKIAFKTLTGVESKSDYVAVVEVHYDEDILLYFEINKGKNVKPKLVAEISLVDLTYDVPKAKGMTDEQILKLVSLEIPLVDSMTDFHL